MPRVLLRVVLVCGFEFALEKKLGVPSSGCGLSSRGMHAVVVAGEGSVSQAALASRWKGAARTVWAAVVVVTAVWATAAAVVVGVVVVAALLPSSPAGLGVCRLACWCAGAVVLFVASSPSPPESRAAVEADSVSSSSSLMVGGMCRKGLWRVLNRLSALLTPSPVLACGVEHRGDSGAESPPPACRCSSDSLAKESARHGHGRLREEALLAGLVPLLTCDNASSAAMDADSDSGIVVGVADVTAVAVVLAVLGRSVAICSWHILRCTCR